MYCQFQKQATCAATRFPTTGLRYCPVLVRNIHHMGIKDYASSIVDRPAAPIMLRRERSSAKLHLL